MDPLCVDNNNQTTCCNGIKHHHAPLKLTTSDKIWWIAEKVSMVAIAVFAAVTDPILFAASFSLGLVIGLFDRQHDKAAVHHGHAACAHSFLEDLTGVKMPAPLGFIANVAVLVAHIDHHPTVFTPLVGVIMGLWAGKMLAPAIAPVVDMYSKDVVAFVQA